VGNFEQEADILRSGIVGNEGLEFTVDDDDFGDWLVDRIVGGRDIDSGRSE
jgi:hypothetical protein